MFEKLQKKWKVDFKRLILILCTFAIGGSACGYLAKKVMEWLPVEKGVIWVIIYILLACIIWPLCVLVVSIPFGQFSFFKKYVSHIGKRMAGKKPGGFDE